MNADTYVLEKIQIV